MSSTKVIDQTGAEVLDPHKALSETTLAVDLERANFDQAIATAHRYPRILDSVVKQIETMACYNEESAENCIYSLPRGGKPIIGPSIGFANILATAWGNCVDGGRPTYTDRKEKMIFAEGVFHDLQTNRRTVIHESRRISGKNGSLYNDDMIAITGKAAASIARRNAILNAVPRAIWHPIWEQALRIVRGDQETFAERKEKAMKAFHQFGVKPEQVYMVLGLKGDPDLTLEHVPTLRGMYQALREGSTTVEEMFDPRRQTGKGFEQVENPLGSDEPADTGGEPEPPAHTQAQAQPAQTAGSSATTTATTTHAGGNGNIGTTEVKPAEVQQTKAEQQNKTGQGSDAAAKPSNAYEYIDYWRAFCAKATSATTITQQHAADRALRKACAPFDEDQFGEVTKIKDERIAALTK